MKSNIIKASATLALATFFLTVSAQTPGSSPGSPSAPGSQNVNPTLTNPGGPGYQPSLTNPQPYGGYTGATGSTGYSGIGGSSGYTGVGGATGIGGSTAPGGVISPAGIGTTPATPGVTPPR